MKPLFIKFLFTINIIIVFTGTSHAQKEFFRSKQVFTEDQLDKLYSSVSLTDSLVLFNAVDYKLYAYNKKDGSLKWTYDARFKTNDPVFVYGNEVYAGIYSSNRERAATIEAGAGKLIKILPFGPLSSKPLIKNGKLYGTAIYEYGCIIAYDLEKDTVLWSLFIAHGYEAQPFYFQDKIVANAEGTQWIDLGYDGRFLDSSCIIKDDPLSETLPCIRRFKGLTHDKLEIKGEDAEKIFGDDFYWRPSILTTNKLTFALYDDKLTVIGNKLKIKQQKEIIAMSDQLPDNGKSKTKLLKADDQFVWILYSDRLIQYDHQHKKLVKLTDLSLWEPHTIVLDDENAWVISGKDGLLYGISL